MPVSRVHAEPQEVILSEHTQTAAHRVIVNRASHVIARFLPPHRSRVEGQRDEDERALLLHGHLDGLFAHG
jgi:hypothetical protein